MRDHARRHVARLAMTSALALGGVPTSPALAGPDIDESTSSRPDAGGTPGTARQVRGLNLAGTPVLARVGGRMSAATTLVASIDDVVDMFVFRVTDPATFVATVEPAVGFETSLWLFEVKPSSDGGSEARPVAGNDAKAPGAKFSQVTFPNPGYEPGTYAIAITPRGIRPKAYVSGSPVEMFTAPSQDGVGLMLPTDPRAVLKVWQGYAPAAGAYGVRTEGAAFIAATNGIGECGSQFAGTCLEPHAAKGCDDVSCCTTVCQIDEFCCSAAWDSLCATLAIQNCASFRCADPGCAADLNDDGQVDGSDLGLLLSGWGPCN